jgi:hypothetical protein
VTVGDVDIDLGRATMMSLFTRSMMVVAVQRDHSSIITSSGTAI